MVLMALVGEESRRGLFRSVASACTFQTTPGVFLPPMLKNEKGYLLRLTTLSEIDHVTTIK